MRKEMFDKNGQWYKGNLHSHTTNSDGRMTPEESVRLHKQYGYSFLCLSEHDYYTDLRDRFDCDNFILLPGVEASVLLINRDKNAMLKTHHIHGILGNEQMQQEAGGNLIQPGERLTPPMFIEEWNGLEAAQNLIDMLRAKGCFVTYNHPVWSRVEMDEVQGLKDIWGIEIYNYGTVVECGEGSDTVFWENMLRKGKKVHCFASDDNHNPWHFFDSFGGYVMVRSQELSHEAIVNHLLAGDYYSSSGPEIYQWGLEDGTVFVECSPCAKINFIVGGPVGSSETQLMHETPLTKGFHTLKGNETYVRVECIDEKGKTAWTNALWLDTIKP